MTFFVVERVQSFCQAVDKTGWTNYRRTAQDTAVHRRTLQETRKTTVIYIERNDLHRILRSINE